MVTLTINDNEPLCIERGWVVDQSRDCECECNPECRWCDGKGVYSYREIPFVLRFTRSAFDGIWTALGFYSNTANAGEIYGNRLLRAIHSLEPASVSRARKDYWNDSEDGQRKRGRDGVQQASRLDSSRCSDNLTYLAYIALEACKREERVVWHDDEVRR